VVFVSRLCCLGRMSFGRMLTWIRLVGVLGLGLAVDSWLQVGSGASVGAAAAADIGVDAVAVVVAAAA